LFLARVSALGAEVAHYRGFHGSQAHAANHRNSTVGRMREYFIPPEMDPAKKVDATLGMGPSRPLTEKSAT